MSTTGTAPSSSPPSPANDDVPAVSRQLTTPTKDMSALDAPVLPAVHDRPPGTGATASSTGTTSSTGTGTTSTATNTSPMVDLSKTRPATNGNGSDHPTVDVRSIPSTACSSPQHKPSLVGNDGDASNVDRIVELSPNSRYAKLNCVLGKGAYKVVYKAIDREEGYEVAWNCFQTTKAEYNELGQEIEILKRVRHPNIINFHDCWYNGGEFVFVTELMTSGTLREYFIYSQVAVDKYENNQTVVQVVILKGLHYLHAHNPPIIHRDIKCDNIFINGAHGEVKIGDMGTAKMKLGRRYTVIGTPEFMAPEMYEEKGYSEKVDVYAFGMCLLEMATGEYPYSECTNAAQVYKKVTQGLKPDCLAKVSDPEVLDLIDKCICAESERWSVSEIMEHPFLTVEPEVVLQSSTDNRTQLTLQVVFKGMDKLSVKFEFNTETDTAEQVVNEMIEEKVLEEKYQTLITHEINRILRELNKSSAIPDSEEVPGTRRKASISSNSAGGSPTTASQDFANELERAKREISMANERALEAEKKAELSEVRARLAEAKSRSSSVSGGALAAMAPRPHSMGSALIGDCVGVEHEPMQPIRAATPPAARSVMTSPVLKARDDNGAATASSLGALTVETKEPVVGVLAPATSASVMPTATPLKDYRDEQPIEDLVYDTAAANNRPTDKAVEWLERLKAQDVMTVGDLRELHDADWASLGLTVFAGRALRNALVGKTVAGGQGNRTLSPREMSTVSLAECLPSANGGAVGELSSANGAT